MCVCVCVNVCVCVPVSVCVSVCAKCTTGCVSLTTNGTGGTSGAQHLQWEVQSVLLRAPCPGSRQLPCTGT